MDICLQCNAILTISQLVTSVHWPFYCRVKVRVMVFNATFNNISVISWQSVLLVEETGVPVSCYCAVHVYVVHFYNSVWTVWVDANSHRYYFYCITVGRWKSNNQEGKVWDPITRFKTESFLDLDFNRHVSTVVICLCSMIWVER